VSISVGVYLYFVVVAAVTTVCARQARARWRLLASRRKNRMQRTEHKE